MQKVMKKGFGGLFWALLLALVLSVAADMLSATLWRPLPRLPAIIGFAVLFVLLALLPVSKRALRWDFSAALLVLLLALLLSRGLLYFFTRTGAYEAEDAGKKGLFGKQRVLLVVPKQGDELRLASGLLEGYTRYGSEFALFYTRGGGETVIADALGLPSSRVYHGGELHEAVLEFSPTLILASREEQSALNAALAGVSKAPPVLYGLLGSGEADFYSENLLSSRDPGWYVRSALNWDRRLCLPVEPSSLSHSLTGCRTFQLLRLIGAEDEAEALVNADRVFWSLDSNKPSFHFVKLTNADGDFIYDYYISPLGHERFPIYTSGKADQPYSVSVVGEHCSAKLLQGRVLEVSCPKGRTCLVTVTSGDRNYSDTVRISNPGRFSRETAHALERGLRLFWEDALPATNLVAFYHAILHFVHAI